VGIRGKIVLIVLPLLIVALVIGGISSSFIATNSVTRIAMEFLEFKTDELEKYVDSQWKILLDNDLTDRADMIQAAQAGIEVFARSIIRSDTEVIFAVDANGELVLSTAVFELLADESAGIRKSAELGDRSLQTASVGGVERVYTSFLFAPFDWVFFIGEQRDAFYSDVDRITFQTLYLIIGGSLIAVVLLLFFARYLTGPLRRVVTTMRDVIANSDLTSRVNVDFSDEIGEMSHTFNVMISELEQAYNRIKGYAYQAVVSQKKEQKIRQIFQKYVPQELIDQFFKNPESMLVGENRELSILFSDIRGFTSISEGLQPDKLVGALNRYFSVMVDIIMNRNGIIDKYIGDAIMAIFGAPVHHDDDGLQSVLTGLDMVDGVETFNAAQRKLNEPEFRIGVGINYGNVTVGNIGTERKMDYTVIGDMVNVASRLEGLTKQYKQPILISETLYEAAKGEVAVRLVDAVAVKGRTGGIKIYTASKSLTSSEAAAWEEHNAAMDVYYERDFAKAKEGFTRAGKALADDYLTEMMVQRCTRYAANPPDADWAGVEVMESK
jgi:adenylate cyclase